VEAVKDKQELKIPTKIYKYVARFEETFVGAGLLAVTLIVFINVLTRYFLSFSYSWSEEVTRYIMVAVAFIGAAICSRKGIHLGIDFFFNRLGRKARRFLAVFISIMGAIFTFALTFLSIKYIQHAFETGQRSAAMNISMTFVYASITIGCGLMCFHFIVAVFSHWFEKDAILVSSEKGG